jgi:hypothetical protein
MDPARFDRLSKVFALRRSRRQALATGGAGLAATGLLANIRSTTAHDATPPGYASAVPQRSTPQRG